MRANKKRSSGKGNPIIRFFSSFNKLRIIIVNLIFWSICILLIIAFFANRPRKAEEYSFLYWAPNSNLVLENSPLSLNNINDYINGYRPGPDLQTLMDVLDTAADDPRILGLFVNFSWFSGSQPAMIDELNRHLDNFREKGKLYYAFSQSYNRDSWLLASGADKTICDPMGSVLIEPYGVELPFYKEALDAWNIDMKVYQSGEFKNAPDRYTRNRLEEDSKNEYLRWLNSIQDNYFREASLRKEIPEADLRHYSSDYAALLENKKGNAASLAIDHVLVDRLMSFQETEGLIVDITGKSRRKANYWKRIDIDEYADRHLLKSLNMNSLAVLNLDGEIGTDRSSLDPDFIAYQIRSLIGDSSVLGLVLRINSPGGTVSGSEEIRRAVTAFRSSGRPVVASISGTGASGGYWIACEADYIFCEKRTITGSIGVYSLFPNFNRFLRDSLSINYEKLKTGTGYSNPSYFSPVDEDTESIFRSRNLFFYNQFMSLVAGNRNIPEEDLGILCEGRIWTGEEAVMNGLADEIGGYSEALKKAADLAEADGYSVKKIPSHYLYNSLSASLIKMKTLINQIF